jgi:hypothetical protein
VIICSRAGARLCSKTRCQVQAMQNWRV